MVHRNSISQALWGFAHKIKLFDEAATGNGAAFSVSGAAKINTMNAESALAYLNQWGFMGIRSGPVEFFKGHNSETISVEINSRVEPISDREFLDGYGNREFQPMTVEEIAGD